MALHATVSKRRHKWKPVGLYRKENVEWLGHDTMDGNVTSSSTSVVTGMEKAQPKHDPYHGGRLLQPPSGRWILEHGRPKCIAASQSTSTGLPFLGGKTRRNRSKITHWVAQMTQRIPQRQIIERLHKPSFDLDVEQQHGSEFISAEPLEVSPDAPQKSGIVSLAASCRKSHKGHISSEAGGPSWNSLTCTQIDPEQTVSLGSDHVPTAENVVVDTLDDILEPLDSLDDILQPLDTAPSEVTKLPRFDWTGKLDVVVEDRNQSQEVAEHRKTLKARAFDTAFRQTLRRANTQGQRLPSVLPPRRTGTDIQLGESTKLTKNYLSVAAALDESRHDHGGVASKSPESISDEIDEFADMGAAEIDSSPSRLKLDPDPHFGLPGMRTSGPSRTASMVSNLDPTGYTQGHEKAMQDKRARKQDRDIRSRVKLLRDTLLKSATQTFEPEVWEGCGIKSDHLRKDGIMSFLESTLVKTSDQAGREDIEEDSSAAEESSSDDHAAKGDV
eukprot:TRINITY_DN44950_c0_g1_i1.p1 TRINITY_DN44950_c0_g1~~TRINITY_DN44950_c0_g1_i1.p1  ORF type:complete len:501 (-),score=92.91 TRINITY_DN44950_c0_g1_i1:22-1524(-)